MTTLVTWGGDAMPDGVVMEQASGTRFATRERAQEITDRVRSGAQLARAGVGVTIAALAEAWSVNAHKVLEFPSWHAYVQYAIDGDLLDYKWFGSEEADTVRVALTRSMHEAGMKYREINKLTGVSLGALRKDIAARVPIEDNVYPIRPELEPEPNPYEGMSKTLETLARVMDQRDRGLTSLELDDDTGWAMGTATGNLSRLERRGLIELTATRRRNRGAYLITEAGLAVLADLDDS